MTFVEAIIAVHEHPNLELCPNEDEQNGLHDICVYHNHEFIGKIRWPDSTGDTEIDDSVLNFIGYN
jgi:hypothetical protein